MGGSGSKSAFREHSSYKLSSGSGRKSKRDESRYRKRLKKVELDFARRYVKSCPKEKIENFRVLGKVGTGSFGRIFVVRHKKSSKTYALKALRKIEYDTPALLKLYKRERDLHYATNNKFIVDAFYAFEETRNYCIVMEYAKYGAFNRLLKNPLSESLVKKCAAQLILALEYLHECKILFRDLKTDNVLIADDFYLKLGDFGCAKRATLTSSIAGPISNMPPEVVLEKDYGREIDWWTLGIFVYEATFRQHPFCPKVWHISRQIDAILHVDLTFPVSNARNAAFRSFVSALLRKDRARRLGMLAGGVEDIKQHHWFYDISFVDIFNKREPMPLNLEPMTPEATSEI